MRVLFIFLFLLGFSTSATTFNEVPLVDQLSTTDAVVYGEYQGSNYKKLKTGEIVTEHSVSLKEVAGIDNHKIVNRFSYKFISPGGQWQGQGFYVDGAPKFKKGEEVVVLLKRTPFGHVINNLGLGKYSVTTKAGKKILINQIFPDNKNISQFEFKQFNNLVESEFGDKLHKLKTKQYVYKGKTRRKDLSRKDVRTRSPASVEDNPENSSFNVIWLALTLGCIGFYFGYMNRRRNKK